MAEKPPSVHVVQHDRPILLGLPTEILQEVIAYLNYLDIESITLSCRQLFDVAESRLIEHRKLKQQFSKYTCGNTDEGLFDGCDEHPARLLVAILDDPRLAAYNTRLAIGDCSHPQDGTNVVVQSPQDSNIRLDSYALKFGRVLDERIDRLMQHYNQIFGPQSTLHLWDHLLMRILALHQGPILALLLTMLPNLNTIAFVEENLRPRHISPWLSMLSKVAEWTSQNPDPKYPLMRLRAIEIKRVNFDLKFLTSFLGLPSLRTMTLRELISPNNYSLCTQKDQPMSNVHSLKLTRLHFPRRMLNAFFARISNLQEIECIDLTLNTPRDLTEMLLRYASHSLSSLTLVGSYGSRIRCEGHMTHAFIGCLRGFQTLKFIKLDLELLLDGPRRLMMDAEGIRLRGDESYGREDIAKSNEDQSDSDFDPPIDLRSQWYLDIAEHTPVVHRLINVLPASAESLTLQGPTNKHVMQQLLCRLPERKVVRLPNIKEILYECAERCVIGMEKACEKVGVRVAQVLKYGDIKNQGGDSMSATDFSGFENGDEGVIGWDDFDGYDRTYWDDYYSYSGYLEERLPDLIIEDEAEHWSIEGRTRLGKEIDEENVKVYEDIAYFEWLVSQADQMMGFTPEIGIGSAVSLPASSPSDREKDFDLDDLGGRAMGFYEGLALAQRQV